MHRTTTSKNQIGFTFDLVNIMEDILQPVDAMLYRHRRGNATNSFDVIIDCSPNLMVRTDPLRLKQVILNLARNSSNFVPDGGFIKLCAFVNDENVQLAVEDSGECKACA